MQMSNLSVVVIACAALTAAAAGQSPAAKASKTKPEYPPFSDVAKGYKKVVSQAGDVKSLYTIYVNKKTQQMLAELERVGASGAAMGHDRNH